jgi:hypothetical protein
MSAGVTMCWPIEPRDVSGSHDVSAIAALHARVGTNTQA